MTKNRFLCIHGHYYQPPRENPWLEAVEVQDSARPYHDWNERITSECYGPNTAARIVNSAGEILDIRNNYRKISFNFGPTLLSWLEENQPEVYSDIVEADRLSVLQREGHGNAMAQAYNHVIMPLASDREKAIQVVWGMEDFRRRFNRDPEGLWLPETGVDVATLEVLAENGIQFTLLAPRQAKAFRLISPANGKEDWTDCEGGRIDPTRPYLCNLPSGRSIVLFFYDGPISQAVAFEGLLNDGKRFAQRVMDGFSGDRDWSQLLHLATDGESYGHHHRHGDMALAYGLHLIERENWAELTNYGQFLAHHPPEYEVEIWENSSWSCVHGVERWQDDCGCHSGMNPQWHQAWRAPLRSAFRNLANRAYAVYDEVASRYFEDPEQAIYDYVSVISKRNHDTIGLFFELHARTPRAYEHKTEALRLLEMVRNSLLMFTSCAWFFDEVSGIETVQNLQYAGRLIQLLHAHAPDAEEEFLRNLESSPSNIGDIENAAQVYKKYVRPRVVDLPTVIANHAITNFDRRTVGTEKLFCYLIREEDTILAGTGRTKLKLCRVSASCLLDGEEMEATVCVLHFGGHDFHCSITGSLGFAAYEEMKHELLRTLHERSLTELVRLVDHYFGQPYFTLNKLFSEGRRELLQRITRDSFERLNSSLDSIYEENRKFMEYLLEVGAPLPQGYLAAAEFVIRTRILEALEEHLPNGTIVEMLEMANEARNLGIRIKDPMLERRLECALEQLFHRLALSPTADLCRAASQLLDVVHLLGLRIDPWEPQNIVFALVHGRRLPAHLAQKSSRPPSVLRGAFPDLRSLARRLKVNVTPLENEEIRAPLKESRIPTYK